METVKNCIRCFHETQNELGHWCLRYHVYVFPKHGMGRNCSAFLDKEKSQRAYKEAMANWWKED